MALDMAETNGGIGRKLMHHLRTSLMTGLLIVVPVGITIFILKYLFNFADGVLGPLIAHLFAKLLTNADYIPGLGVIAGLLVIYLTGLLAGNFLGQRLLTFSEEMLERIPLVNTIYSSSKQVTSVLSSSSGDERRAVFVEFPTAGSYAIGFQTGHVPALNQERYQSVFVPTAPNPTSGYILYVEASKVFPAPFGVEEAMKIVVSGGVVTPETINVHAPG